MSFIFGGNTGTTYEDLQRKRKLAEQLAQGAIGRAPGSIGEGLSAIGKALAYRSLARKGDALESKLNTEADSIWRGLFNTPSQVSQPQPFNVADISQVNMDQGDPRRGAFPTGSSETAPEYTPGDRDSFVAAMMPHALRVSQQTGIDPRIVIAQAALETGYGKSAPGNNYFGIKSHGKAGGNTLATTEVIDGKPVQVRDSFRAYGGMGDSAMGYAEFLQENPRYKAMLSADGLDAQIEALGASGYATDPNYAAKVRQIATSIGLPESAMPQSGPGLDKIVAAMGNPMIRKDPAKMALLQALMGQQLQAADPMRALELERAQLEIENLRNPTPKPTDDMREYQAAREQGFEGSFLDYQTAVRKAGASNITQSNGSEVGTIPQGYELITDPETGARRLQVIAGGPVEQEQQQAAQQAQLAEQAKSNSTNIVLDEINIARDLIQGESMLSPATGITGGVVSMIDSTRAGALKNRLETIKANIGFDKLQAMRDASPTGGALGQVSEFENKLLQAVHGSLVQSQRAEDILYNLDRLERIYNRVINEGIPDEEAREMYRQITTQGFVEQGAEPGEGVSRPTTRDQLRAMSDEDFQRLLNGE